MLIILLWLKKIELSHKVPKFKVGYWVRVTKNKNIFSKGCNINWSRGIFVIDSMPKTNSQTYKIKDLNRGRIIASFYEKELSSKL